MNKLRPYLRPIGIVAALVVVMVLLGFVERSAGRMIINGLDVRVQGAEGIHFIDEEAVRREVLDHGTAVMGAAITELDLPSIEQRLRKIPSISKAEVYHTMNGLLHVNVVQREPVVRVFDRNGTSFYIDRDGFTMPVEADRPARVMVVVSELDAPASDNGVRSVHTNDSLMQRSKADVIHGLALFIRNDPFWNALIDHAVLDRNGEFELVPRIGGQRLLIGDGTSMEQRFAKLRIFYEKGMPRADWRRYDRIDLRFGDQVVCTKRTTP